MDTSRIGLLDQTEIETWVGGVVDEIRSHEVKLESLIQAMLKLCVLYIPAFEGVRDQHLLLTALIIHHIVQKLSGTEKIQIEAADNISGYQMPLCASTGHISW